jgi:Ca2+/Na+ antiporter
MNAFSLLVVLVFLWILYSTHQTFWVIVAGLLLLAYFLTIASKVTARGVGKTRKNIREFYSAEMKEMDSVTGKYPAKFFDSAGKAIAEKVADSLAPAGVKSYKQAENMKWAVKDPMGKLFDSSGKILDSLGKLFSK